MKRTVSLLMSAMLSLTLFAGCSTGKGKEDITIAFLPNEDSAERSEEAFNMLKEEVQVALGDDYNVKIAVLDDYAAVTEAMLSGTAQIAWESGGTFATTYLKNNKVLPIVSYGPQGDPDKAGYNAYIATNIKNKADFEGKTREEKLQQLKGKSFSFVSATSTSGCLVPTQSLWGIFGEEGSKEVSDKEQINVKKAEEGGLFSDVQYGGNHPGSVTLIVQDKVYAGAYCCNYGDDYKDELYTIDEQFVPNGPLWVNTEVLGEENVEKLTNHFAGLTPENAVNKDFFRKDSGFFFEAEDDTSNYKFFKTNVDHYSFIIEMAKSQQ